MALIPSPRADWQGVVPQYGAATALDGTPWVVLAGAYYLPGADGGMPAGQNGDVWRYLEP
jgi:hypothetical protein